MIFSKKNWFVFSLYAFSILLYYRANANTPSSLSRQVPNLIAPVQLNADTTLLNLSDFFVDPAKIDSLVFANNYKGHWNKKDNTVQIISGSNMPALTELKLFSEGHPTSILLKKALEKGTENNSAKKPRLVTLQADSNSFSFSIEDGATALFVLWQNLRLNVNFSHNINQAVTVIIPEEARHKTRSYIRIYACNTNGTGNDLLIPLESGRVITDYKTLDRFDEHTYSIYSILVDRFYDGNQANNKKTDFKDLSPKANYNGGDLEGITAKLKAGYFDSLHVNTLCLSPIVQNEDGVYKESSEQHSFSSHYLGYWPLALTKIDDHLGNDSVFKNLVTLAHRTHSNVLLNLVANRLSPQNPVIQQHPDWETHIEHGNEKPNTSVNQQSDTYTPTINLNKPGVIKMEVDSALFWVQKFDIDGFEHDATKYNPVSFYRSLTLSLKKLEMREFRPYYQIGDMDESEEHAIPYSGSGLADGQFDFNLYYAARAAFANSSGDFQKLSTALQHTISVNGSHHLMGNITGNYNQPRIASLCGRGLTSEDTVYNKMSCFFAFIATIPGIPVLYYGDEIGMSGAESPDNQQMMRFENLTSKEYKLKTTVARLLELKAQHLSLMYGDLSILHASNETFAYQRSYFNQTTVIVFNNAPQSKSVSVKLVSPVSGKLMPQFGHKYSQTGDIITVTLPARSFEIFITSGN